MPPICRPKRALYSAFSSGQNTARRWPSIR
jgi:hypothetical protein